MTEIDIIALASVLNGVKSTAGGTNVADVTMLAVGGNFHLCIIVATLALTFVISLPTGHTVRRFRFMAFEEMAESLIDVSVHLGRIVATFAFACGISSPIPVLGAGCLAGIVPLLIVS